jgi:betaine-aldehyde dehydrogenase
VAFDNTNPATGALIGVVHDADSADVDAAVAAAQRGFETWSAMTATERGRILHRAAVLLRARNEDLAVLEVADCGKPVPTWLDVLSASVYASPASVPVVASSDSV